MIKSIIIVLVLILSPPAAWPWSASKNYSDDANPLWIWIPAAGCNNVSASSNWDLFTSAQATAGCVTGTSNISQGVLQFPDSGPFSAQTTILLPADWGINVMPQAKIIWSTSAITGSATWLLQFVCVDVASTATNDPAFPTVGTNGYNVVTTTAPGTANRLVTSAITSASLTLPTSCTGAVGTSQLLHIRILRDGAGSIGTDTIGAQANLIGVELTIYRIS